MSLYQGGTGYMATHAGWDLEQQWLSFVLNLVALQLAEATRIAGDYSLKTREERRSLWEEGARTITSNEDWIELAQASTQMGQGERSIAFYQALAKRLERIQRSPYFGRIDFHESGTETTDRIYIGISGLHDNESGNLVVYDWRAPISGLFYDAEPGPAQYECQAGTVSGDVLLKRQYRIVNGKLELMFDTDLKIDDSILQELLGRNIDEKMRSIVTSIQREQNQVIRDSKHSILLVQGPAGSGKTAIALHRAAYLLYKYRESITARNIVIFSPNRVFSDYISAVLPELGEENIVQTTFHEYAGKYLGGSVAVEDMYSQLEYLLAAPESDMRATRIAATQYKASEGFRRVLQGYVSYLESGKAFHFFTVQCNGKCLMTREEMADLFVKHSDLPLTKRLEKVRQRVLFLLAPIEEERLQQLRDKLKTAPEHMMDWEIRRESKRLLHQEFEPIKSRLGNWAAFNVVMAYKRLFESNKLFAELVGRKEYPPYWEAIKQHTLAALNNGRIPYEDASPLLFLKRALEGAPALSAVKHVIVDEAQDYTPLQYELFRQIFPRASFTVVGDLNQAVHPYMHITSYENVMNALHSEQGALVELSKSYRSTRQIMQFCRALLTKHDKVDVVRREGASPLLVCHSDIKALTQAIASDITDLQQRGMPSVAVLCRTAVQSHIMYQRLKQVVGVQLITSGDDHFHTGPVVIPVYLAKGLEFDAVIIADAGAASYHDELDRGMFYTACTRALHELHLYYTDTMSPFISAVDSSLYQVANASATGCGRSM